MNAPQVVHVRVNDAATGDAIPVRIRISDDFSDLGDDLDDTENTYPPLGYAGNVVTTPGRLVGGSVVDNDDKFALINGAAEFLLPDGTLEVEIHKGLEYLPILQKVERKHGQISMRFALERKADFAARGWYACDTRAHFLTPDAAALEGAAQGLDLVQLVVGDWWEKGLPPNPFLPSITGQTWREREGFSRVAVNTFNRGGPLGNLALLHCHRPVFPLRLDEPQFEHYTLADWCGQCHRKGGLVVWPSFPGSPSMRLACLLTGGIDAIEWSSRKPLTERRLEAWYQILNCGFRVPIVGASGKISNAEILGAVRTYANVPPGTPFTPASWVEAVKAGRTFATSSRFLGFTLGGVQPGGVLSAADADLPVRLFAPGFAELDRLDLVANGLVVWELVLESGTPSMPFVMPKLPDRYNWIAARGWSGEVCVAHSSPIYLDKRPDNLHPNIVACIANRLDRDERHCLRNAAFGTRRSQFADFEQARQSTIEARRDAVRKVFADARRALQAKIKPE